jgi:hypothetical protein
LEATLLMAATRPTVLITDAWNAQSELPKRKDRHTQLIGKRFVDAISNDVINAELFHLNFDLVTRNGYSNGESTRQCVDSCRQRWTCHRGVFALSFQLMRIVSQFSFAGFLI